MHQKSFVLCSSTALLALAMACSKSPATPVAPASTQDVSGDAAADGSTLKVPAPAPVSPVSNAQPDTLTLIAGKVTGKFDSSINPSYQFEIRRSGAAVSGCATTVAPGSGSTVSYTPSCTLEFDTAHTWRVRAVFAGAVGPWSADAAFRSPAGGYINGNEVFDPLINGKTVGEIVGNVTFIPGVGVKLHDFSSHIRYRLPQTLTAGEFSIIITGMATNNEGDKTKVMAMSEGLADIVTNDRRFTIEKRGNPAGYIAWRFITRVDQIDTVGAERVRRDFDPGQAYLFTTTWNGFFNLRIQRGGSSGETIYSMGKPYQGVYDPNPHYAFIGAPAGRSGLTAATVPGMIVRNVWISPRPRPSGLN